MTFQTIQSPLDASLWDPKLARPWIQSLQCDDHEASEVAGALMSSGFIVGEVFASTSEGSAWLQTEGWGGLSFSFVKRLALAPEELIFFCLEAIRRAQKDPEQKAALDAQITPEFNAAAKQLIDWLSFQHDLLPLVSEALNRFIQYGNMRTLH